MDINRLLTPYNFSGGSASRVRYIVIHYVGATGGAKANCEYYASRYVGASAHYFVGFEGEIWQSVEEKDIAWHCGAKSYRHLECRKTASVLSCACGIRAARRQTAATGILRTPPSAPPFN